MITRLLIQNFKVHNSFELNLSSLNVFTGLNGMGKSSILQALLLLRQSNAEHILDKGLMLGGDLVMVGTGRDAFHKSGTTPYIRFEIDTHNNNFFWAFNKNVESDFLPLQETNATPLSTPQCSLFTDNFQYISAEHIGPKGEHNKNAVIVEIKKQISHRNGQCEYAAHYLYQNKDIEVNDYLLHSKQKNNRLLGQVNAWLGEVSTGVDIVLKENTNTNDIQLRFRYESESEYGYTDEFRPENVGFGVSYVLPIITALLSAKKDAILLIENPEAHLHPEGQAALAKLIARTAHSGVQVFIETHSDHIINGILVAIKQFKDKDKEAEEQKGIAIEDVRIFYIERAEGKHESLVHPIPIGENGRIRNAPDGFFNRINKDLKYIIGF